MVFFETLPTLIKTLAFMLLFDKQTDKKTVFEKVADFLEDKKLKVILEDQSRPWGGFFVLDENQKTAFIELFFEHLPKNFAQNHKLSPKILIVCPQKRLSWQYHSRRAEIWKLIGGQAGVVLSDTDQQGELQTLAIGQVLELVQGKRHRLVGLDGYGIVAEIWQHTDPNTPSDENDIVRIQDDFGR